MENLTPMLRQYLEIKKQYPGTILFFRLGDFYELFNEDAVVGARELEITLTARHKDSKNPVPMCGVPHHAAASYISRLVKKGFRVAICEQTEDAGKGVKLVKREVVRVITPGTAIDQQLSDSKESVFLAAVSGAGETFGVSFLELSTGEFVSTQIGGADAWTKIKIEIESYAPRELLFPQSLQTVIENSFENTAAKITDETVVSIFPQNSKKFLTTLTALDDWLFEFEDCAKILQEQFNVLELSGFGMENKIESVRASGACLRYALETQRTPAGHVSEINYSEANDYLMLDAVTLRNLEIVQSRGANKKHTLYNVIDKTITGMGGRLLHSWLLRPSSKKAEISTRLLAVSELMETILRDTIRRLLKEISDLERLVGRLNLGVTTPRDLLAIKESLMQIPRITEQISDSKSLLLQVLSENIFELPEISSLILRAISEDSPSNILNGGVIREGYNAEFDELKIISKNAKQIIAQFEDSEKQRTGIQNLKIKFNNVFGYFIEISKGNVARVPPNYERRQTLTNAERYSTPELRDWEQKVLGAEERIKELETALFNKVRKEVAKETIRLQSTARALATLDALASLAEVAARQNFVAPVLHDGDEIDIKDGRHPIVEFFGAGNFIPNDIYLNNSTDRLLIITGPNMGGKSTVLRQIAIIQILAQIGSFVPASYAKLPIVDRIWTRVGASDDLASGRSTFMVEMTETAAILHNATPRSLILLDEIGRGTSTFDGLSIAWAVAEYLHNSPDHSAKTLFATHYHELTELAEKLPGAKNYQVLATEKENEIVFLHKLQKGKASKSYGIAVAQLAGLPANTIARAREVLKKLEQYELAIFRESKQTSDITGKAFNQTVQSRRAAQFSLFGASNENTIAEIIKTDIEKMSHPELVNFIRDIKKRLL